MNVVLIIEMPVLRSSKANRAPLLNIQIHNNNNTIASSSKDQIELLKLDKNSTTTMQAISEETVLSGNQHSAEGSIASSCTVTPRCMTPSSPALTEKSTFSDIEMKTASSTSVPVLSPLPVAKSVSTRPKNNRKNKSGKNQGCNTTATSVNNNNGVSAVASSSCSGTGGCKPIQNLKTVEEAGSSPKLRNPDSLVCYSRPSLDDQMANLNFVMQEQGCFETHKGLEERRDILARLNQLVYDWVKGFALGRNMAWHKIENIGGRIVTYGSYKLGISHQGADIDALCVAPNFISRQDYFASFYDLLSFLSPEVTELRKIEEAYVPVIKFRYNGIEIDMTFAQLNVEQVPTSDLELLRQDLFNHTNLDPKCLRSLNGYRATMLITQLVPDAERFRVALRAVKLWAQGQGLYSNILGYLGGFSWAVLVAKICIDFPNLSAPELVQTFFHVYREWRWPEPVALIDFQEEEARHHPSWDMSSVYGSAASASWNPERNVQERYQVMPILTPTYPHQNSTFNVTANTLKLIKEKMGVAADICDQIMEGKESWETLFQTCHIFHEYEHFLIIVASAQQPGDGVESSQLPIRWFGLIESKIRHFANNLEKECRSNLASARIWPKPFAKKAEKTNTIRQLWFIGLRFLSDEKFDYSRTFEAFHEMLFKQATGFYNREMRVEAHYLLKSQLTSRLSPTEIQEIVSSQSQKAREVAPSGEKTPPNSNNNSYAEVATKPGGNHSFITGNSGSAVTVPSERGQHLGFPPLIPPTSLPPPLPPTGVRTNFYASPSHASVVPLRVHHHYHHHPHQHSHYSQHQQQRSPPIMERTWTSSNSGQVGYVGPHSSTTKYSYDRGSNVVNGVGNVHHDYPSNERGSTGGESSSSSTAGLDISYNSLESDNGRSISYSSDKFPPSGLVQARLHHPIDRVPYQPLGPPPGVSASSSSLTQGCNLFGTTPTYDASVPPPPSPVLSKGPPTFAASNSRPLTLSSQQRDSTGNIFGQRTGNTFDKNGKGTTVVRLYGCPKGISPNFIRQWMKIFGEVIEGPRICDDSVSVTMSLNQLMPAMLPIEGYRVSVQHRDMPYYCYNCLAQGHQRKDCPNASVSWFKYLGWLQFTYNIPDNYFVEFRQENNNVCGVNFVEKSRRPKFDVPQIASRRSFE